MDVTDVRAGGRSRGDHLHAGFPQTDAAFHFERIQSPPAIDSCQNICELMLCDKSGHYGRRAALRAYEAAL